MPTPYRRNAQTPAGRIAATPGTANWGGFFGLLQEYSGASAGYSLRKIGSGPVVRLRRARDNAEKDFYAGDLIGSSEGSELVTNGGFDTDSDWTKQTGWSITGGQAVCDGSQVSVSQISQNSAMPATDDYYLITFTIIAFSDGDGCKVRVGQGARSLTQIGISTPGRYSFLSINPYATQFYFSCEAGDTMTVDDVSCKPYTPTVAELWAIDGNVFGIGRQDTDSAYATTWYDQSGSGNDATQAVSTAQPLLIRAGVTNTVNGKAALEFDGVDDWLDFDASSFDIGSISAFSLLQSDTTSGNSLGLALSGQLANKRFYLPYLYLGDFNFGYGASFTLFPSTADTSQNLFSMVTALGSGLEAFRNGTLQGTTALAFGVESTNVGIGGRPDGFNWDGTIQEIIVYDSDQSANRIGIETNINDHYGIY